MARPNVFGLIFKVDATEQKKFDQISKKVKGLSNEMNKSLGGSFLNMKTLATGFFAAVAASKITGAINDFALMGDRIAKTANTLGLSTSALQELEYVAGQQGATVESLNSGYQNLNKNLGMMTAGSGKLYAYLKKGNPQLLAQVKGAKNSEEAFNLLTDALGKETDVSKRAALATAAFGGSAQDMIKFSKGGKESIDALREAKRKFGIMSEEAAKASEAFNDAQDDLKQAIQGGLGTVLAPILPKLTELIKLATEWIVANKELIGQKLNAFLDLVSMAVNVLVKAWDSGLIPALIAGYAAFVAINTIVGIAQTVMGVYSAISTLAGGKVTLLTAAQWALNTAMTANPIGLVIAGIAALVVVGVLLYKNWDLVIQKAKELWGWLTDTSSGFSFLRVAVQALLTPVMAVVNSIKGIVEAYQWMKAKISGDKVEIGVKTPDFNAMAMSGGNGSLSWQNNNGSQNQAQEKANALPWKNSFPSQNPMQGKNPGLQSANMGVINSNTTVTNKSMLDVNIGGLPQGSTTKQKGSSPGITVRTGAGASRR